MRLPILRVIVPTLCVLLWISGYNQAAVSVKADKTFKPYDKIILEAGDLPKGNPRIVWRVEGDAQYEKSESGKYLYVWAKPGTYKVRLTVIEFKSEFYEEVETTIKVEGKIDPFPDETVTVPDCIGRGIEEAKAKVGELGLRVSVIGTGAKVISQFPSSGTRVKADSTVTLTTDGKIPDPPPDPTPTPDAPIKASGFRVLIIEESKDRSKLPVDQRAILFNKQMRDWLKANTVTDKENPNGSWYIFDQNDDISQYPQYLQDAMRRKRDNVPWLIISNGTTGYEGPLPKNVAETMDLLKKYLPKTKSNKSKKEGK